MLVYTDDLCSVKAFDATVDDIKCTIHFSEHWKCKVNSITILCLCAFDCEKVQY